MNVYYQASEISDVITKGNSGLMNVIHAMPFWVTVCMTSVKRPENKVF